MKLHNKRALITGAASGIGRAGALLFAEHGARLALLDRNLAALQSLQSELSGADILLLEADVSDENAMRAAFETVENRWGELDILWANAGINGVWAPVDEISPAEWDKTLAVNLRGTFLSFHFGAPLLRRAGENSPSGAVALLTASGQGTRNFSVPGSTAYAVSKAAQSAFCKKMALELASSRVRVNVLCPGSTQTEINSTVQKRDLERIALPVLFPRGKVLLNNGAAIAAEEVAKLALFLSSDDARFITGTEVWIDGAMSLLMG